MSEDCPHCVFEITEANCRGCFEGSHYKPKPITNADRIRGMSDDGLAKWISGVEQFALTVDGAWSPEQWLNWLKEEVKDE